MILEYLRVMALFFAAVLVVIGVLLFAARSVLFPPKWHPSIEEEESRIDSELTHRRFLAHSEGVGPDDPAYPRRADISRALD